MSDHTDGWDLRQRRDARDALKLALGCLMLCREPIPAMQQAIDHIKAALAALGGIEGELADNRAAGEL